MNNTFVKGVIEHFARTRKVHHDTQGQPVLFRIQGAKVIGNLFGKHRNHAIGKVNRRAAVPGFPVHRRIGRHELRNIRDVDAQLKSPIRQDFNIERIIEIARRFRIDRDGVASSEIIAAGEVPFRKRVRQGGRFFFDFFRKPGR